MKTVDERVRLMLGDLLVQVATLSAALDGAQRTIDELKKGSDASGNSPDS